MAADPECWLSELRGRRVAAAYGTVLGRVVDLALSETDRRRVEAVLLRQGRGPVLGVRCADVSSLGPSTVTLRPDARLDPARARSGPLLARDVLDAQVVDVAGRRLRRVSDVRLRGAGGELQVVGVDTGWGSLLRRLGLRRRRRRAGALIDWQDVRLAPTGTAGHDRIAELAPSGLSELVARLPPEHGAALLQSVEPDEAAAALSVARPRFGGRMMAALPTSAAGQILAAMPVDDAVAALRHIERGRGAALLERVPTGRAAELRRLLALAPHTAGGLMTTDFRTAIDDEPLETVRARLADDPPALEGLTTVFVLDAASRYATALTPTALLGGTPPRRLPPLTVDTPLEDVIDVFAVEDVLALPVLDEDEHIVGAVAIDDVLEELLVERLPQHRRRYRRASVHERRPA